MQNQPTAANQARLEHPSGKAIIAALKQADIRFVVAVPDIVTSDGLLWPIAEDADLKLVRVCKEDEAVSICAAMSYSDTRAMVLMQQTGLMDSLNALRALGMEYGRPICMMVGLQGKEPHLKLHESAAYGVRIIKPILDVMQLSNSLIEEPGDIEGIVPAIDRAYQTPAPHCFLIGRSPEAP